MLEPTEILGYTKLLNEYKIRKNGKKCKPPAGD